MRTYITQMAPRKPKPAAPCAEHRGTLWPRHVINYFSVQDLAQVCLLVVCLACFDVPNLPVRNPFPVSVGSRTTWTLALCIGDAPQGGERVASVAG